MTTQRIASMISPLAFALLLVVSPAACTSSERAAQETYELAQFEQKQGNAEHARKLYQEVVTKYPDTSWAEKARTGLSELQPSTP
jgi:TolA-binding protein